MRDHNAAGSVVNLSFPVGRREQLHHAAIDAAQKTKDRDFDSHVLLVDLARHYDGDARAQVLAEAVAGAQAFQFPPLRAKAWAVVI